ncbi:PAS domain S-box protein [Paenibacillus mesophilus]|uniref:ATP-binding protein n=1 Tax=Paenibacillus mesophilus TaxID=2582849 RepID=UPI00110E7BC9|nr:ATP-binding protein [Paenibacillus mesophilus]TMV48320.1 PAS domain S-box protein [Paenibacillus mesophilus]
MPLIAHIHDGWLMVLSYVIALASSYTVITLIGEQQVRKDRLRLFYSAFTTAIGLWSAGFIAMMAYRLPLSSDYYFLFFLLSAVLPFCAFFAAFSIFSDASTSGSFRRHAAGSVIAGTGVCMMHFLGVYGMHSFVEVEFGFDWIFLSWLWAVIDAYVSFRIAYRYGRKHHGWKALSSIMMGLGLVGMHFLAMRGTTFRYDGGFGNRMTDTNHDMFTASAFGVAALFLLGISVMSVLVNRRLQEAEQKYSSLFEQSPELVIVTDMDGVVVRSNRRSADVIGYEAHEIVGRNVIDFVCREDLNIAGESFVKSVAGQGHAMEIGIINKSGERNDVSVSAIPMLVEGSTHGVCLIVKNITSDKQMKQQLQQLTERLMRDVTELKQAREMIQRSEKLSVAGELAAGIAHEIRNPLTSIKGFIQLLKERMPQSYYGIILDEIGRIELITGELLMLSKPQAVEFQPVHVPVILDHVATLLESEANMHNVQIARIYEGHSLTVCCDSNQLKQVFINMLKNSIEAMPDGGTVTIDAKEEQSDIVIVIRDEGVGISEEKIRMLGQPFYTTKEKGTGLGLMVSMNIIENHGGRVQVYSQLGIGTQIHVVLPSCPALAHSSASALV